MISDISATCFLDSFMWNKSNRQFINIFTADEKTPYNDNLTIELAMFFKRHIAISTSFSSASKKFTLYSAIKLYKSFEEINFVIISISNKYLIFLIHSFLHKI